MVKHGNSLLAFAPTFKVHITTQERKMGDFHLIKMIFILLDLTSTFKVTHWTIEILQKDSSFIAGCVYFSSLLHEPSLIFFESARTNSKISGGECLSLLLFSTSSK